MKSSDEQISLNSESASRGYMKGLFPIENLKQLIKILWTIFLWYGPIASFWLAFFYWQIDAMNGGFADYFVTLALISGDCAFAAAVIYLFKAPWKSIFPTAMFLINFSFTFLPVADRLREIGFGWYIRPQASYLQKHCNPKIFVQDGKNYAFGICDLYTYPDGQTTFGFAYDSSGDLENYDHLSLSDKKTFVKMVRKYFNDDPNEIFEISYFHPTRYYHNFYSVDFDDTNDEGFTLDFGKPPNNPQITINQIFEEIIYG